MDDRDICIYCGCCSGCCQIDGEPCEVPLEKMGECPKRKEGI
jgi:hypothetical protein